LTDLSQTISPKSDQTNADDLIGGPRTIKVTKVSRASEPEQPIAINYEGDNGKPYKPCKSMRRILVAAWGSDGAAYVGRRMTLYRDDKVVFGGMAVGGIRISHMSGLDRDMTMALTATRQSRKPYTVRPLPEERTGDTGASKLLDIARQKAALGASAFGDWREKLNSAQDDAVSGIIGELREIMAQADNQQEDA
jgi:hypothetical protein